MTNQRPPRLARALLTLLLPRHVRDAFAGDLEERFQRAAAADVSGARRRYWKDVLSPTVLRLRREVRGMTLTAGASPTSASGDGIVRSLFEDARFAVRTLAKSPAFTAVAVLSLALGIGPNTAIFSLVSSVLLQDPGVDDPARIVDVYTLNRDGRHYFSGYPVYELVSEGGGDFFEDVTAHSIFAGRFEDESGAGELVLGEMVTGSYFEVMGVRAALGRTFLPEEDATPGTHPVLVVSDGFWRNRLGADPSRVGSEVRLNGRPYTVIGVAPADFRGRIAAGVGTDFWVPMRMYPHLAPSKMSSGDLTVSGRLREGRSPEEALAAIDVLAARYNAERNAADPERRSSLRLAGVSLADVRLHPDFDGVVRPMVALLFVAVGLVLLVACVNLAGFLLSRAVDRRKEMAVRIALGAGRPALLRQLLVESLTLATLGAGLGLVLGQLAARSLAGVEVPLPFPIDLEIELDARLLLFTAGTAILAALLFGLTPALEAMRAPVASTLRSESGASDSRHRMSGRGVLVAAQMALSTVLLFGAALFLRSLQSASEIDVGFETGAAGIVRIEPDPAEYDTPRVTALVDELLRRVRENPGVSEVAVTGRMPLGLGTINSTFAIPGVEPPPEQRFHLIEFAPVTGQYFTTLGIPLLEGRSFEDSDREGGQSVGILSRAAAEQYWPGESALGKVLHPGGDPSRPIVIVGVVGDVKLWSLSEAPRSYLYLPLDQFPSGGTIAVVARGRASAAELAALIRSEARTIDPTLFITDVGTMDDHLDYIYFLPRMAALLLTLIGALALALACIGLYGMVSYGVSRRTREMGIRLALGANRQGVVGLVLRGGLTFVVTGATLGILGSVALGRFVESFLYGVSGLDPFAVLAAPIVLGLVAMAATYLPARRASRVDPVRALRME